MLDNAVSDNELAQWRPTEEKRKVAELLATGYSQNRAAAITGTPQTTIAAWWNSAKDAPQFRALVADIQAQFEQVSVLDSTIRLAELLHHQAVTGERDADDPTVVLARELLRETSWKRYAGHKWNGTP